MALLTCWDAIRAIRTGVASPTKAPTALPRRAFETTLFVLAYLARSLVPWLAARLRGLRIARVVTVLTVLLVLAGPGWELTHRVFLADTRLLKPGHNTYLELGRWLRFAAVVLELIVTALPVLFWWTSEGATDKSGRRAASVGVDLMRWTFATRCRLLLEIVALELALPPMPDSIGYRPSFWFQTNAFRVALLLIGLADPAALLLYRRIGTPDKARSRANTSVFWAVVGFLLAGGVAWLASLTQDSRWQVSLSEREQMQQLVLDGTAVALAAALLSW